MNYLEKAEAALDYLELSENEFSRLKALVKYAPDRLKVLSSTLALESSEKSVTGKHTASLAHPDYEAAIDAYETVTKEFNLIQAKRNRAELTIEFWRSLNSAQKLGNPV